MVASLAVPVHSPSHGFVKLPHAVLLHPNLSLQAKLLYTILRRYARDKGFCFPGCARLAADLRRSERTVRRAMDELVAAGIVTKWRRGLTQTNVYHLGSPAQGFSAPPDRPSVSDQERSPVTDKGDTEERDEGREFDTSKAIPMIDCSPDAGEAPPPSRVHPSLPVPTPVHDDARMLIFPYVKDLARELHDEASLTATTTRAVHLFRRANVSMEAFQDQLLAARQKTQERSAAIRKTGVDGRKAKVPYFFAVLERSLGVASPRSSPTGGVSYPRSSPGSGQASAQGGGGGGTESVGRRADARGW